MVEKKTVVQLVAILRQHVGDWSATAQELMTVPHWHEDTVETTLDVLFFSGVIRAQKNEDDASLDRFQWVTGVNGHGAHDSCVLCGAKQDPAWKCCPFHLKMG